MATLEVVAKIDNLEVVLFKETNGIKLYRGKDSKVAFVVDKDNEVLFSITSEEQLELYEE